MRSEIEMVGIFSTSTNFSWHNPNWRASVKAVEDTITCPQSMELIPPNLRVYASYIAISRTVYKHCSLLNTDHKMDTKYFQRSHHLKNLSHRWNFFSAEVELVSSAMMELVFSAA